MRIRAHLPAVALFAALSLAWSFPLILHLGTHVPGGGPGDNLCFVWNLWWMRTALHQHLNPFYTTFIFHPIGVDLTQHTHTALSGVVAATLLAPLSVVAAQNVLLLVSLFLNAMAAYLLAHRVTGNRFAALAAGIAFGGAAPILVRLGGHFNLVAAWTIPLAVLALDRALERRSWSGGVAAGAALAAAAYSDYYYFLYALVLIAIRVADRWFDISIRFLPRAATTVSKIVAALAVADIALIAAIALAGPFTLRLAGLLPISMQTTFNERVVLGFLLVAWALSRWRPILASPLRRDASPGADLKVLAVVSATLTLAVLPLAAGALRLLVAREYTSQQYGWRSAPAGIDVATFFLGNPLHALYGPLTSRAYAAIGASVIEGTGWIGAVPLVLLGLGWRGLRSVAQARRWRAALAVFVIWALGPYLNVLGANVGFMLPQTVLRFVPIVANARIPGRAMVAVSLAAAMLLALTLARLGAAWSTRRKIAIVALLLLDVATAPLPLYRPEASAVYAMLRDRTDGGAVLELPLGLRDGFGEIGRLDERTLFFQTVSGHPMFGGFVGRLPERVKSWYRQAPVVSTLLKLSDPACPTSWVPADISPESAREGLRQASVRYVVLDGETASAGMIRYVSSLPLTRLVEDNGRALYEVRTP
jgi:hypothetical protein